jgi:hypothetical protein
MAAYLLTEPSSIAANPPAPRAPTTSMSAPEPLAVTVTAGGPASTLASMSSREETSSARATAALSARTDSPRSASATVRGTPLCACIRGGMAAADTRRSGALRRCASRAAHSAARSDSSEPSTQATMGMVAMTCLLAVSPLAPTAGPYIWLATRTARSARREVYPHSLSYQPNTFTRVPAA